MASNVEELTIKYEEDGIDIIKELDKEILSKGAWATVIFRYKQWSRATNSYGNDKYSIRRYRKRNGKFSQQSKFNISSSKQGRKLVDVLNRWMEDET